MSALTMLATAAVKLLIAAQSIFASSMFALVICALEIVAISAASDSICAHSMLALMIFAVVSWAVEIIAIEAYSSSVVICPAANSWILADTAVIALAFSVSIRA